MSEVETTPEALSPWLDPAGVAKRAGVALSTIQRWVSLCDGTEPGTPINAGSKARACWRWQLTTVDTWIAHCLVHRGRLKKGTPAPKNPNGTWGAYVRAVMCKLGWSAVDLEARTGLHRSQISRWIHNHREPTLDGVHRIALAFSNVEGAQSYEHYVAQLTQLSASMWPK